MSQGTFLKFASSSGLEDGTHVTLESKFFRNASTHVLQQRTLGGEIKHTNGNGHISETVCPPKCEIVHKLSLAHLATNANDTKGHLHQSKTQTRSLDKTLVLRSNECWRNTVGARTILSTVRSAKTLVQGQGWRSIFEGNMSSLAPPFARRRHLPNKLK